MTDWQELERKYFMPTFSRVPVTLVKGRGALVWDEDGREYLDFVAGWGVNVLGHCHPVVVGAVKEQVDTLIQTSNQFYTVPQVRLAQLLVDNSCLDKVFLCNSGAEANEGAVKLARRYGKLKLGGAYEVITTIGSFHGRTLAMSAATGQAKFQQPFLPMPQGFINVESNSIDAMQAATTARTCAVMLELVQGEGGVNLADRSYLAAVRDLCRKKGILLIVDEIQTGMGRTGTLFAYQQYGIEPDIMTLAKGLGGGVPVAAVLAKDKASVFTPGDHGSTFGGNPVSSAASYATVKYIIDNDIASNADRMGRYFTAGLERLKEKHGSIADVRGKGLLLAVAFHSDIADDIAVGCLKGGLLVNRLKPDALRFMPPLIIGEEEVDRALAILDEALAGVG